MCLKKIILSCFQQEQAQGQTTPSLLVRSYSYHIPLDKGQIAVGSHKMVEKTQVGKVTTQHIKPQERRA